MFERACLCHCAGAHAEPSRATLHIDDRMVTVFSRRRRSKTNDILSLHLLHNLLESERRDMVALVDDHMAILGDKVLHFLFPVQALNDCNIHPSSPVRLPATDLPNRFRWQIQEHYQPLMPLIEQLLPVNHNQRIDLAIRDQPGRNGGLSESRWSAKDSFVMLGDLGNGFQLERP